MSQNHTSIYMLQNNITFYKKIYQIDARDENYDLHYIDLEKYLSLFSLFLSQNGNGIVLLQNYLSRFYDGIRFELKKKIKYLLEKLHSYNSCRTFETFLSYVKNFFTKNKSFNLKNI